MKVESVYEKIFSEQSKHVRLGVGVDIRTGEFKDTELVYEKIFDGKYVWVNKTHGMTSYGEILR